MRRRNRAQRSNSLPSLLKTIPPITLSESLASTESDSDSDSNYFLTSHNFDNQQIQVNDQKSVRSKTAPIATPKVSRPRKRSRYLVPTSDVFQPDLSQHDTSLHSTREVAVQTSPMQTHSHSDSKLFKRDNKTLRRLPRNLAAKTKGKRMRKKSPTPTQQAVITLSNKLHMLNHIIKHWTSSSFHCVDLKRNVTGQIDEISHSLDTYNSPLNNEFLVQLNNSLEQLYKEMIPLRFKQVTPQILTQILYLVSQIKTKASIVKLNTQLEKSYNLQHKSQLFQVRNNDMDTSSDTPPRRKSNKENLTIQYR